MKDFLGTFVITLIFSYIFLSLGGILIFESFGGMIVFVAFIITILITVFMHQEMVLCQEKGQIKRNKSIFC